jgi:hypothetical protein
MTDRQIVVHRTRAYGDETRFEAGIVRCQLPIWVRGLYSLEGCFVRMESILERLF